ncbi:MAG: RlmE family RNA methyltransferase [Treponema sp.]|jgi:23S rRNA (uridine2552-2'-O)-methyltransferase|nr:RlmE family RNA methyltransferase [Treponema sp.]
MGSNSYEKPDFWSKKAFSEGFPARSVYKLKEIDEKFTIIKKNSTVLDLGAAPGSWTVFLLRRLAGTGNVVSVDLNPLASDVKADNLFFYQGDLNDAGIRRTIREKGEYDLVVCDAAPLTTGNKTVDTARSEQLVEMALWYAETMLKRGGNFVVKIFQNGDQQAFLKTMRQLFTTARGFKPKACRSESFETYLIGINKK